MHLRGRTKLFGGAGLAGALVCLTLHHGIRADVTTSDIAASGSRSGPRDGRAQSAHRAAGAPRTGYSIFGSATEQGLVSALTGRDFHETADFRRLEGTGLPLRGGSSLFNGRRVHK